MFDRRRHQPSQRPHDTVHESDASRGVLPARDRAAPSRGVRAERLPPPLPSVRFPDRQDLLPDRRTDGSVRKVTGTEPMPRGRGPQRVLRTVGALVLAVHGLVHLMGVALLWRWGEPGELRYADVHPEAGSAAGMAVGGTWLVAVVLFLLTAGLLAARRPTWRPVGLLASLVSIAVLVPSASIAWAGLVVDAAVVVAVAAVVVSVHRQPHPINTSDR